jgi:predicted nucleotidyltransferase
MSSEDRLQILEGLLAPFGVASAYAFGSRGSEVSAWLAGSGSRPETGDSDVDIGVRPLHGTRWGVKEKVRLAQALEDLLGCARVDLVVLPEADPFVAAEVIRGERLYAADSEDADEYDLYVLRRAGDLLPLERERVRLILGEEP